MIRSCAILVFCLSLGVQWAFGAIHCENTDFLIDALKSTNFRGLNFETPANNLSITTTKGEKIDLRQLEGKLIVLSFWTINTPQWPSEIRSLEKLQSRYSDKGLEIVALNLVDPIEKIKNFLHTNPTNLRVAFDPDNSLSVSRKKFTGDTSTLFVTDRNSVAIYEIPQYPTSYVIDKDGRVLGFFVGTTDWNSSVLENVFTSLMKPRRMELAQEDGPFQTDARQGMSLPPQAPTMGGPTKRGPVQAPLGPQAPIPVPDEGTSKTEAKSLPFQPAHEVSGTPPKPPRASGAEVLSTTKRNASSGRESESSTSKSRSPKRVGSTKSSVGDAQIHRTPTPYRAPSGDPFTSSGGRPALPLAGSKPVSRQKPGNVSDSAGKPTGLLPAAKPYYPSAKDTVSMKPDSSGRVLATVPGTENREPGQYSGFPKTGASDLPAAQPLPDRNLIGGSILDSFGNSQKTGSDIQPSAPKQSPVENQPNNIFEQFGQDVMSLGEGIRGAFSKIIGSR